MLARFTSAHDSRPCSTCSNYEISLRARCMQANAAHEVNGAGKSRRCASTTHLGCIILPSTLVPSMAPRSVRSRPAARSRKARSRSARPVILRRALSMSSTGLRAALVHVLVAAVRCSGDSSAQSITNPALPKRSHFLIYVFERTYSVYSNLS